FLGLVQLNMRPIMGLDHVRVDVESDEKVCPLPVGFDPQGREPFARMASRIIRIPVERPSVRSNSLEHPLIRWLGRSTDQGVNRASHRSVARTFRAPDTSRVK